MSAKKSPMVCSISGTSVRPWAWLEADRKSTRLNSSHGYISYAVFCLKKKNSIELVGVLRDARSVGAADDIRPRLLSETDLLWLATRVALVRGHAPRRQRPEVGHRLAL